MKRMYRVTVTKNDKVIRVRHFSSKKKAEEYEDYNTMHNPIGVMCDFKIEVIRTGG